MCAGARSLFTIFHSSITHTLSHTIILTSPRATRKKARTDTRSKKSELLSDFFGLERASVLTKRKSSKRAQKRGRVGSFAGGKRRRPDKRTISSSSLSGLVHAFLLSHHAVVVERIAFFRPPKKREIDRGGRGRRTKKRRETCLRPLPRSKKWQHSNGTRRTGGERGTQRQHLKRRRERKHTRHTRPGTRHTHGTARGHIYWGRTHHPLVDR